MTVVFAICGLAVTILFALAGARTGMGMRTQRMKKSITYQERIDALYKSIKASGQQTVTTILEHAAIANSRRLRVVN